MTFFLIKVAVCLFTFHCTFPLFANVVLVFSFSCKKTINHAGVAFGASL